VGDPIAGEGCVIQSAEACSGHGRAAGVQTRTEACEWLTTYRLTWEDSRVR
jgi:hypothetical protein